MEGMVGVVGRKRCGGGGGSAKNDRSGHFCMGIYLKLGHSESGAYLVGRIEI